MDLILFIAVALTAIGAAVAMILSRNAVYSALFLILNFMSVAAFYLVLGAPFIALAQITIYAGAI
ncbi:NADH-quinone oxidoreductase subunit J, partial [bacterium]